MHFSAWKKSVPLLLAVLLALAAVLPALTAAGASPQSGASSGTVKLANSSSHLNVRSGPGTQHSTLGSLRQGATVTITGEQNGWYSIAFNGRTGYVKASYITRNAQSADTSAAFAGRVKLASSSGLLNVRKGPGTGYATLGQLSHGAKVSVTAAQGGWYAIAYNGSTGYVSSAYIVKDGTATPTATNAPSQSGKSGHVTASSLNVRKGPGTGYARIGSLRQGESVTVTATQNGWHTIVFKGSTGYVSSEYIKLDGATAPAATNTPSQSGKSGRVTASSLNVRKGPGTGYARIGSLRQGESVTVTATQNGWHTIVFKGSTGYVSSEYIKLDGATAPTATNAPSQSGESGRVTASSLNVRKGPGTGYAKIGSLRQGDTVTYYELTQGFYRISYQGATAYVSAQYIKPVVQHSDLKGLVIGIDAGHQAKANYDKEPVAPGSSEKKAKVSSGTQGVSTRTPEHEVNLKVALLLQDYLEDAGATVIMSRTSADVNISNVQRAQKMNEAKCDLVLRIHCNGSTNASVTGAFMLVPSGKSTTAIAAESKAAAATILKSFLAQTGAKDLGITPRDDLSGFNWSTVPVCLIEMGHQTNVQEDKKLASSDYQQKCARGLYEGIRNWYLNG